MPNNNSAAGGVAELTESRNIPKRAARLAASPVCFAAAGPEAAAPNKHPITMLARTSEPVSHWYWGRIVHDMAGFEQVKDRVIFDWCHWWDEQLGYADTFKADAKEGLNVSGFLISTRPDDRAADIIAKGELGVPYEGSIEFDLDSAIIEFVGENQSTEVNGSTFQGPGYVVRKWRLVAIAVCPHGADPNTSTEFAKDDRASGDVRVNILSKGPTLMSTNNAPAAGSAAAPTGQEAPAAPTRAQFAAELARFTTTFGADNGAKWFGEQKSFPDALELHCGELKTQLSAKDTEIAALKQKLASLNLGEETQLSANDGEQPPAGDAPTTPPNRFEGKLSPGLAKFAGAIKLPGKK